MQESDHIIIPKRPRLTIRIAGGTMSFSAIDVTAVNQIEYEPYPLRTGISTAANLREAFKAGITQNNDGHVSEILKKNWQRALVMLDTPVLLVPIDEYFEEQDEESDKRDSTLYNHALTGHENDAILSTVLTTLNAVALCSINKDWKMVLNDHFEDIKYTPLCAPVWNNLYRRSFTGQRRKLYVYFHEKKMEVFSFLQNRFRFCNNFEANHTQDCVYFILYVWKQLGMDQQKDELHMVGTIPERETLLEELRKYLQNAYIINPTADFNRAPITNIKGIPYDLMTMYLKGR